MVVYVVTVIIFIITMLNLLLGQVLYKEPQNQSFFKNVNTINFVKEKYIKAAPRYVLSLSILTGVLLGLYLGLAKVNNIDSSVTNPIIVLVFIVYLMEITRTITLKDGELIFSRFLYITKKIKISQIIGIYIYSYNKKFLNSHAYTTKLVVTDLNGNRIKFSLSSLNNRAVLNLMKDVFGVSNNKMYIAKTRDIQTKQQPINGEL